MKRLLWIPMFLISCQPCLHAELDKTANALNAEKAVRCILGEYESGTLEGMTATAEAMRNRIALMGLELALKGVYGCKAVSEYGGVFKRGARIIPAYAVKRAFKAWEASKRSNYTLSATHWEAIETFGKPKWVYKLTKTAKVGQHTFFK